MEHWWNVSERAGLKNLSLGPVVHHKRTGRATTGATGEGTATNCLSHGTVMIRDTVAVHSTYISSSLMLFSKSNLYWNPEQPPPSTIIRKQLPSVAISFRRFTQLSLIWSTSDVALSSVCGAADVSRE